MVSSPVKRVTREPLGGDFGPDRGKPVVVSFVPGGDGVPDTLVLRPKGSRRGEIIAVVDCYRYALRCRVGRSLLEKARDRKAKKATRLAQARQARAERRLLA